MTTLSKRATREQKIAMAIIEGAIKTVIQCHPENKVSPTFASSVAKRAVGVLTGRDSPVVLTGKPVNQVEEINYFKSL